MCSTRSCLIARTGTKGTEGAAAALGMAGCEWSKHVVAAVGKQHTAQELPPHLRATWAMTLDPHLTIFCQRDGLWSVGYQALRAVNPAEVAESGSSGCCSCLQTFFNFEMRLMGYQLASHVERLMSVTSGGRREAVMYSSDTS